MLINKECNLLNYEPIRPVCWLKVQTNPVITNCQDEYILIKTSGFLQYQNLILLCNLNHYLKPMKKLLLLIVCIGLFSFPVSAQKLDVSKVPTSVLASFSKQFPAATDIIWEKEGREFEAAFKIKVQAMTVSFSANGTLKETETAAKLAELPAAIRKYVSDNYKGKTIQSADKTVAGTKVTYEVVVEKGKELVFDANGKFIKKVKE